MFGIGSLVGAVRGFIASKLSLIVGAAFLALAVFAGVMWWEKGSAVAEAERLRIQNDRLNARVDSLTAVNKISSAIIQELQKTVAGAAERAAQESRVQQDISNAPNTDDGPVAPVLDRALRALGGVRQRPDDTAR